MPEPASQAPTIATAVAILLSLMVLFAAAQRLLHGKPLLEYEPRQRVPWGPGAALISLFCVLLPVVQWIGSLLGGQPEALQQSDAPFNPSDFIRDGIWNAVAMIGFALLIMLWLAGLLDASARDLGLPRRARQLALDIGIGCCGCLAAMLPIYLLHGLLTVIFEPVQQHLLIEQLQGHRSPALFLVGTAMAVFAAPLFEEVVFRLLLQGYLERLEDQVTGFRPSERPPDLGSCSDESESRDMPLRGRVWNLPHGWAPVLLSGTAFGLAHLEHGVSALPLVLFGIVLGYLYQRTHRLAPSVAAHMLFNAFTMLLLWLG